MQIIFLAFVLALFQLQAFAQRAVFDRGHFNIVNENGAVRLAAENTYNSYLNNINNRLSDVNVNLSAVVSVQSIILSSLTEVDQGLKSALAVRQMGSLVAEIAMESSEMIRMAKSDPQLLLFAEAVSRQLKDRGVSLFSVVSAFVLKEGENVLMDFEKRDALLKKIALELRVIRALVFSMKKSMYWAKANGLLRSLNPYQGFINQDLRLGNDILVKSKLLKQ
ncbi:hypothetical protein ASU31_00115 [Pedobacter ginsenosidimutans]|uniref:Plasmid transfer protein n=1 Tax=Pedobacter ginsenosidimutans TaxID=687842 RepID=A0A0T5VV38_9SPHI|nr:hypothetical protein [Pedobacter ginsenosidimutans]KRT17738.1 hypothetical protein ASU31_00115 [Pedobacter ginsenosidimutans]